MTRLGTKMESCTLPFEIIMTILLILPAKVLVRCQNVCQAWRDLIRNPCFIRRHFEMRASDGNGYLLHVPFIHTSNRAFTLLDEKTYNHVSNMQIPLELDSKSFVIVGSCNGLLCIADATNYGNVIYLCNPYLRQCRSVCVPRNDVVGSLGHDVNDANVSLGFGYYEQTDDYKIVKIIFASEHEVIEENGATDDNSSSEYIVVRSMVEVYSTVNRVWKNIEVDDFPWAMLHIKSEAVVNDSIHWKVIYSDIYEDILVILAFHMGSETFKQLHLPNYEVDGEDLIEYLGAYKGNLSLFLFHLVDEDPLQEQCYLWVMTEYGTESSWTKTHTIMLNPTIATPLLLTNNAEVIYDDGKQSLMLCDLNSKKMRQIKQMEEQSYLNIVPYVESLVLLDG